MGTVHLPGHCYGMWVQEGPGVDCGASSTLWPPPAWPFPKPCAQFGVCYSLLAPAACPLFSLLGKPVGGLGKQLNPRLDACVPCLVGSPDLGAKGRTHSQVDSDQPILDLGCQLVELPYLIY